jgi:hypothetical protein
VVAALAAGPQAWNPHQQQPEEEEEEEGVLLVGELHSGVVPAAPVVVARGRRQGVCWKGKGWA